MKIAKETVEFAEDGGEKAVKGVRMGKEKIGELRSQVGLLGGDARARVSEKVTNLRDRIGDAAWGIVKRLRK